MAEVDQMTAPEVDSPKGEGKKSSKKSSMKLNLIVIVVSQLILAGGGFLMVSMFIKPDPAIRSMIEQQHQQQQMEENTEHAANGNHAVDLPHKIYLIEDVIVNPAGTRGSRYLSVSLGVEMNSAEEHGEEGDDGGHGGGHGAAPAATEEVSPLDAKKPQLRDALINILSAKTIMELTSAEEKEKMRQEILAKFTEILEPEPVHQIYFVDFVLQ